MVAFCAMRFPGVARLGMRRASGGLVVWRDIGTGVGPRPATGGLVTLWRAVGLSRRVHQA